MQIVLIVKEKQKAYFFTEIHCHFLMLFLSGRRRSSTGKWSCAHTIIVHFFVLTCIRRHLTRCTRTLAKIWLKEYITSFPFLRMLRFETQMMDYKFTPGLLNYSQVPGESVWIHFTPPPTACSLSNSYHWWLSLTLGAMDSSSPSEVGASHLESLPCCSGDSRASASRCSPSSCYLRLWFFCQAFTPHSLLSKVGWKI